MPTAVHAIIQWGILIPVTAVCLAAAKASFCMRLSPIAYQSWSVHSENCSCVTEGIFSLSEVNGGFVIAVCQAMIVSITLKYMEEL